VLLLLLLLPLLFIILLFVRPFTLFLLLGFLSLFSCSHSSDHWAMFSHVFACIHALRPVLFQYPATEADPQRLFSSYRSKVDFKSELNRSTNFSLSLSLSFSGLISFSLLLANIFFFQGDSISTPPHLHISTWLQSTNTLKFSSAQ